jgi:hypothetical protein
MGIVFYVPMRRSAICQRALGPDWPVERILDGRVTIVRDHIGLERRKMANRTAARRVQAPDQDADRAAVGGYRSHVVLGFARFPPDQHAQGRWLADTCDYANRSAD